MIAGAFAYDIWALLLGLVAGEGDRAGHCNWVFLLLVVVISAELRHLAVHFIFRTH